jgi:allophanate hydrolase subunit 2
LLVGNNVRGPFFILGQPGEAGLEIEVLGFRARFLQEYIIAMTVGDLDPRINNLPAPM